MRSDERPVILFDLDGTVLDSAPGIIAAQQWAIRDAGIEPPPESVLRSDLGPPPAVLLARVGVPEELIPEAVASYRKHYLAEGVANARVFDGIIDLLDRLAPDFRLATATMKLISTAIPFLQHHGLSEWFEVVGGAQQPAPGQAAVHDKTTIITATRAALGDPDPKKMIMVGDRHSDITGGRLNGIWTIAVGWGYGSRAELLDAEPDVLIDHPDELPAAAERLLQLPTTL